MAGTKVVKGSTKTARKLYKGYSTLDDKVINRIVEAWHSGPKGYAVAMNLCEGMNLAHTHAFDIMNALIQSGVPADEIARKSQEVAG